MPNHCANLLRIKGPDEELRRFAKAAQSLQPDGGAFDLNRFVPFPKELEGIVSGGTTIDGKKVTSWREEKLPDGTTKSVAIPDWEMRSLVKRFGATNSYDWHCNTYGTKWGVYDVFSTYAAGVLEYHFQSAWSPFNIETFGKIVKKFPLLKFTMKFAECGSGFYGYYEGEDGEVTSAEDWDTKGKSIETEEGKECKECGEVSGDGCYGHYDPDQIDAEYIELLNHSG